MCSPGSGPCVPAPVHGDGRRGEPRGAADGRGWTRPDAISRSFAEQIGPEFHLRELEAMKVKGKERPVEVCELQGADVTPARRRAPQRAGAAPSSPGSRTRCHRQNVGRGSVRNGGALLIVGEAGVGKTTVLEHALASIAPESVVVRSACYEHLQAIPYAPWVETLDQVFRTDRMDPSSSVRTGSTIGSPSTRPIWLNPPLFSTPCWRSRSRPATSCGLSMGRLAGNAFIL